MPAPASTALISTVPNGAIPTVAALVGANGVDVSSVPDGSTVTTLGLNAVGDGGGGPFYFAAGSVLPPNGLNVFTTNSTGRWIRAGSFSGVAQPPISSTTYSGFQETFLVLSGAAPAFTITYTLPPSTSMVGRGEIVVKSLSTGLVTVTAAGADKIFDTSEGTTLTTSLTTGQTLRFQAVSGRFYRTDDHNG